MQVSARRGIDTRANNWWRRLHSLKGESRAATDTYAGDHWSVVRSIPDTGKKQGWQVSLWVLSAGYGLISAQASLHGYSATFAYGHEDSVGRDPAELAAWWRALSQQPLGGCTAPRILEALLRSDPRGVFLIAASPNYLTAVKVDLIRGIEATAHQARVVIVSSEGGLDTKELAPWLVPSGSELQQAVGGTRGALHARVARRIVREAKSHEFELAKVRALCKGLARPGSGQMPVRAKQSDADVQNFIRKALRADPSISYTRLLRMLRDSGLACEMRRFKGLYNDEGMTVTHGN
jgi:hypothetical protein